MMWKQGLASTPSTVPVAHHTPEYDAIDTTSPEAIPQHRDTSSLDICIGTLRPGNHMATIGRYEVPLGRRIEHPTGRWPSLAEARRV